MAALRLDNHSTIRLDQALKKYQVGGVDDVAAFLATTRDQVQTVELGRDFIRSLDLNSKDVLLEDIGDLPHLRAVSFMGGSIPAKGLAWLLRGGRGLEVLRFSDGDLHGSRRDFEEMDAALAGHSNLQEFSFINFDVVDNEGKIVYHKLDGLIKQLCTVKSLTILRLEASNQERMTFDGTGMASLFSSTHLQELHLSHFCLSSMHLRMLTWAIRKAPLEKLSVQYAHLNDEDISKLSRYLGSCQHLQELDLSGNIFGNEGCIALCNAISESKCISKLTLLDNKKIGKDGYSALSDMLLRNKVLSTLVIPGRMYNSTIQKRLESNAKNNKAALAA